MDEVRTDGPPARAEGAPRWLELSALAAALTVAAVGSLGLLLAVTGHYTTWLALLLGVPCAAGAVFGIARRLPAGATSRAAHAGAAAAVVLALAYLLVAGSAPSQNVVLTRDPGSYLGTARWLVRDGGLEADARGKAFAGVRGLHFSGPAVYDMGKPFPPRDVPVRQGELRESGDVEFQFSHLSSVVLAAGYDVGGPRLLFRTPAVMSALSLLLLYAVTVRITGRPFTSLLAPTLLALCLPFLYVARNTYSESFTSVLLWGTVLVLTGIHRRPRVAAGAAGGLLLGALVCTRIDALLYVGMVFPLAALSIGLAEAGPERRARLRAWAAVLAATTVVGAIGWVDLNERSGRYIAELSTQISPLRKAVAASAVGSVVALVAWLALPPLRPLARRLSRPAAPLGAGLVAALLLFGWLVRPSVQTATTHFTFPLVEQLQRTHGLPIDPDRTYAEDSLRWMAWYLGIPALLAAIGGLGWATWQALRGKAEPAVLAVLVLALGAGGLYWWAPEITPDHLWATRRFVPATFPALAVFVTVAEAAVASSKRLDRLRRQRPAAALAAGALVAVVALAPAAATTAPLWRARSQAGYLEPVLQICDALPEDAAVIVTGSFAHATLSQSLRSWCGVSVAGRAPSLATADDVRDVAAQVEANGFQLYVLGADRNDLVPFEEPGGPRPTSTTGMDQRYEPEQTLDRAPSRYLPPSEVLPVPTPFALHLLRIDPT